MYVALTRAKEKLIITGVSNDFTKQLEDVEKQASIYPRKNEKINPILVKKYKSYLDWILLVYLYEKENTKGLLELNKIEPSQIVSSQKQEVQENNLDKIIKLLNEKECNQQLLENIKDKIEYEYQNKLSTAIPTKSSVTKIKQMKEKQVGVDIESLEDTEIIEEPKEKENSAECLTQQKNKERTFEKPKFLQEEKDIKITSAQKGTLIHLCMQKLNPKEEYDLQKIKELIQELQLKQIITEKEVEAINLYKILEFTKSNIWEELKTAKEIYQEKPFYINVPAKQIYEQDIEENILVQGIIDLYYIDKDDKLVLLDYKTDYVKKGKENELVQKYKKQLDLYKEALEQSLNKQVDKVYIYSVYLGKEIELK